jgi:hypothetical protein
MDQTSLRALRAALAATAACAALAPAAHAAPGSIVFVDHDQVWLAAPDGGRRVQVTHRGGYAFASQADDGTIVALRNQRLERMDRRGVLRNPPVPLWLGAGVGMFTGPYHPQVSPDGSLVAYGFGHQETVCDGTGCTGSVQLGTAYSRVDRYTEPDALGNLREWTRPSWLVSGATLQFSPGSGYISEFTPNVIQHLPGQPGAGDEDVEHAGRILDDPSGAYILFGAMTRAGDKLAAAEGTPPHATRVRLYHGDGVPHLGAPPALAYRCELTGAPGGQYDSLSWAPDGSALAYEANGSIYVVTVGDLSSSCAVGASVRIAAGHTPSWGPSGMPRRGLKVRASSQGVRGALARGLRIRVMVPGAGAVRARARAGGRRLASGNATARRAGQLGVRLRFTPAARARLRDRRRVVLRVFVTAAGVEGAARVTLGADR